MHKLGVTEEVLSQVLELAKNIIAPGNRAFMPRQLQEAIDKVLDRRLPQNWRNDPQFIKDLRNDFMSQNFETYNSRYFAEYYTAYYIPNNIYKIQLMLLELIKYDAIDFNQKKIKILDIGTATGTTAFALIDIYEILTNIFQLYGITVKLPLLEIDGIERSHANIEVFLELLKEIPLDTKRIKVNPPKEIDVLSDDFKSNSIKGYDIVFASNVISEFKTQIEREIFAENILNKLRNGTNFILLDTAILKDTLALKKIQYKFADRKDIVIISPCGKINSYSQKCKHCYSFRRENLVLPETMKLLQFKIDEADENEKLKWSYVIFHKSKDKPSHVSNSSLVLSEINDLSIKGINKIQVEIVSGKIADKTDKDNYYLKICDQTEEAERVILKVPKYFELPKYSFGDILEIVDAKVETVVWTKPPTVKYAIVVNPEKTVIKNITEPDKNNELIKFHDVDQDNLKYFLFRFFSYEEFQEGQFEILQKVLCNQNVLGILATGGGKSLTFQLPALLKPGVAIVVSPLKSLMDDQVYNMQTRFGLDFVERIHGGMSLIEKQQVLSRFRNGHIKILYVAPERLQQKSFQRELKSLIKKGVNINYFPIDEAHCISEWGHDFRPSYARLYERNKELTYSDGCKPPIVALTATASDKVRDDMIKLLKMKDANIIHRIVDRKELSLEVIKINYDTIKEVYSIKWKSDENEYIKDFPIDTPRHEILLFILKNILPQRFGKFNIHDSSGLIFTIYGDPQEDGTREKEGARWLSKYLNAEGIKNKPWFAKPGSRNGKKEKLSSKQKEILETQWEKIKIRTQDGFIKNNIKLLCTTKGFGMGIDKPNIRYIIHFGFPGSMEAYFQQIGRAGRDREHSHCILLYDPATDDCKKDLETKPIPKCFVIDETTKKYKYNECSYGRRVKCDYAKQIYFIESAYPTEAELQSGLEYFVKKAEEEKTFPYVYSIKEYMIEKIKGVGIAKRLPGNYEKKIVETLHTLNIITEFNETYFRVNIKSNKSWQEIKDTTNNEIIRQHIDNIINIDKTLLPKVIKQSTVKGFSELFDIREYISVLRSNSDDEIMIDEVVQFFKLLEERDDIELKFNWHVDYGYEIRLNPEVIKIKIAHAEGFSLVNEWKKTQYIMLKNITEYAELSPFDVVDKSSNQMCRRAKIMSVFATDSASVSKDVKCNFCDNCGFNNSWEKKADKIVASQDEKLFVDNIRRLFSDTSKNKTNLVKQTNELLALAEKMKLKNYFQLAKNIASAWLEQIKETDNIAANFILAIIEINSQNLSMFYNKMQIVFNQIYNEPAMIQNMIKYIHQNYKPDLKELYFECLYQVKQINEVETLNIFDSSYYSPFDEIETYLGLNMIKTKTNKLTQNLRIIEAMEYHG